MFLLDTDHIGIIQRQTEPEFNRLSVCMSRHAITDFYFSIISFHEQVLGWNAYLARAHDQQAVVRAYGRFVKRFFATSRRLRSFLLTTPRHPCLNRCATNESE